MANILDHIVDLISKYQHGTHMCHTLSRREEWEENLGECLVDKCIMLHDYTPTNIVNKYDHEGR